MGLTVADEAALAQVKSTVEKITTEYKKCLDDIIVAKKILSELPRKTVPFADMKAALVDSIDRKALEHDAYIRGMLISIATGVHNVRRNPNIGEPILFDTAEGTASINETGDFAQVNMLVSDYSSTMITHAFCSITNALLKAKLTSIMSTLTPADFGYDLIGADKIGTDRVTRRAAITAAKANLATLEATKVSLHDSMHKLGIRRPGQIVI